MMSATLPRSRHELRRLLAGSAVSCEGRLPGGRSLRLRLDASGLVGSWERSLRRGEAVLVTESPAPLAPPLRSAVQQFAASLLPCLQGLLPVDVDCTLDDEVVLIERLLPAGAPSPCTQGAEVLLSLHARSAGTVASWEGDDGWELTVTAGTPAAAGAVLAQCSIRDSQRSAALAAARRAVHALRCHGVENDRERLLAVLHDERLAQAQVHPSLVATAIPVLTELLIERPGMMTTVQDLPGRTGCWEVGVPPSGPMDDLALRLANRALGNPLGAAGLELTMGGLRLHCSTHCFIALAGAPCAATINGASIPFLEPVRLAAGAVLEVPPPTRYGIRTYLAVRGGIDSPLYLGSRSTFTLGGFGGHLGRSLCAGDRLTVGDDRDCGPLERIPSTERPSISATWQLGVQLGPHASPDFLTAAGMHELLAATWRVSPQSNRTGVRLLGPPPQWARTDGGEAGLHPSNVHDNAYAFGAIDLTGDLPVVLGPDGPSLGGFVCPAVVVGGQRWKLGQLRPGDKVQLVAVDAGGAAGLRSLPHLPPRAGATEDPVLHRDAGVAGGPARCLRRQGDEFLLLEYGPPELDLGLRLRVQALYERIAAAHHPALLDLVPGIRSLQIHYDPTRVTEAALAAMLLDADTGLGAAGDVVLPSRIVHLPLSWDDPATRKAIDIYTRTVNPTAPWCPWNIEFIRRINGLDSVQQVHEIVYSADYLVYGLGDVYLGAPVATPLDPRHRLVTTKYNPARTWTPENAVGIGGAYLCIYGMEGPGGYQFVGRTVQIWNSAASRKDTPCPAYAPGTPWLLRQFDRIRFFPVSAQELLDLRQDFPAGRWEPRIESGSISSAEQSAFLQQHSTDIARCRTRQQAAFAAERTRWAAG